MERAEVKDMITAETAGPLARIESAVDLIAQKVGYMESHMKEANGRTAKNEEKIDALKKQISDLESELPHTAVNCPQNGTLQEIKTFVETFQAEKEGVNKFKTKIAQAVSERRAEFIKTATAVSVMVAASALVVNLTFSIIGFFQKRELKSGQVDIKEEVDMINTPVRTRGGTIQWYPSGVLIDSLKRTRDTLHFE